MIQAGSERVLPVFLPVMEKEAANYQSDEPGDRFTPGFIHYNQNILGFFH
jgi:hypothetical protein